LRNIKFDIVKETCWSEEMVRENPKNFYAWEHRRSIANSNCTNSENEMNLTEAVLENDPKNYLAWQHRQWAIKTFKYSNSGMLANELSFTERFIEEDIRNNSAWNQRFFVLKLRGRIDFAVVKKEFFFVTEKIKIVFDNESSWNYLRGIIETFDKVQKLQEYDDFLKFLDREFVENQNQCRHLVGFLIDMKIEMILTKYESNEMIHTQQVRELCNLMAGKIDTIRKNYWKFVYKNFYYDKLRLNRKAEDCSGGTKENTTWKEKIGKKISQADETFESTGNREAEKKKQKNVEKKKCLKSETAKGIGTDLLFDIMNKYNR
jgi:protein farnesyltransferase/geranylgeranyltransferase type-1 subunit alpha